jgi:cyclophilin family peptidyl-prolyl cis-trans isomerase
MKSVLTTVCFLFTLGSGLAQVKPTTARPKKKIVAAKPVFRKTNTPIGIGNSNYKPGIRIKITTDSGVILVRLYDSTPLHRDNFVALVRKGFYDSLLFHRVIKDFMIQGGDPQSKNAVAGTMLGNGGDDMERIPAEFRTTLFHKRGVLAAARDGNPQKASSACQFYLVQGRKLSDQELDQAEVRTGRKYTITERMVYKTLGGTPWLDGNYTVFGEVEMGLEVIDKIASVPRDPNDRPIGDVRMKMEVLETKTKALK